VYVNGDYRNDLGSLFSSEWFVHTFDEVFQADLQYFERVLHGVLLTLLQIFEHFECLFCPVDLRYDQRDLRTLVVDPDVPWFLWVDVPVLCSALGITQVALQSQLHMEVKVVEPLFDLTHTIEIVEEPFHLFIIHRHHGTGGREWVALLVVFEYHCFEPIEAVHHLLGYLAGVVTLGQDVQQRLIRDELETWEFLLLFIEVSVQLSFALVH